MLDEQPRRYGQWAGDPKGRAEDLTKCREEVMHGYLFVQCNRYRGHGKNGWYCKQHAKRHPEITEREMTR